MVRIRRPGFSEFEKAEIWRGWKSGKRLGVSVVALAGEVAMYACSLQPTEDSYHPRVVVRRWFSAVLNARRFFAASRQAIQCERSRPPSSVRRLP